MNGADALISRRDYQVRQEVSAVGIISHPSSASPIIAIATWNGETNIMHVVTAKSLMVTETSYAQSLLFVTSSSAGIRLMSGLSDGSLAINDIAVDSDSGEISTSNRKVSSLGTRPLQLCPISSHSNGDENVIAIGLSERMSVVFEARDRIDFSSVSKKVGLLHRLL